MRHLQWWDLNLDLIAAVRSGLAAVADPIKAPQMQAYMKSAMPYHGVPAPKVKLVCRDAFAAHPLSDVQEWDSTVRALFDQAQFREERYVAVALSGYKDYAAYQNPDRLDLYRHLIVTGAWWDTVDAVAADRVGPLLRGFPEVIRPEVLSWAGSAELWLRRTSIIAQLTFKEQTDLELLRDAIELNTLDKDFFIRKAIGWALRQYARTDPDWVRGFVRDHDNTLSGLSAREALKHL